MNPRLLNVIFDNDDIIFKFPQNTLLDKITDVWSLIMNYYKNYYPFMIGVTDKNYRELRYEEAKTDKFIKLFATAYKNNNIRITNAVFGGSICVEEHCLCILRKNIVIGNIFAYEMPQLLVLNDKGSQYECIINSLNNICVSSFNIQNGNKIYVLLDLFFN